MTPDAPPDLGVGCRVVEWDSEFFGRRIARIEPAHLAVAGGPAMEDWCAARRIDCAYLLADVDDQTTCQVAQAHGFRLVDVRVTLETAAPPADRSTSAAGETVRPVRPEDVDALKAIARSNHRDTRFYADGHFDPRRCDDLYELWIDKSCRGWADQVFVIDVDGEVAGYLTCHVHDGAGQIGLVAVAPASRGRGAGSALVARGRRWFADQGVGRVSVVTQARNAAGLRLYQRAGMTVQSIQLWFHKWW